MTAILRWPWRHPVAATLFLAASLVLLSHPLAGAASDVFGNVAPASQLPSGGLADRYPLGNYALDQHFDAIKAGVFSGVDVSGVPPMIAYFLANVLWQLTAFLASTLITLFTFAFSLDLVNGSQATGGAGALQPVSAAIHSIYQNVFGEPWLVVTICVVGLWAMWRALVQRRYAETAGALAMSLVYLVVALAFVAQPERTIGSASRWTNEMSAAFLSISSRGTIGGEQEAKRAAADQLFGLLVYEPWTVLEFGGTEHCTEDGTGSSDSDPVSVPVRPLSADAGRDAQLSRRLASSTQVQADGKACVNNRNKYAPHFLRFSPGSDERNAEYDALNDGNFLELPGADPASSHPASYPIGVPDKPATDAMEQGGQYQRLLIAVVIFVGELGAFLLLGALSLGVILAQVLLLLLLAFAPVALVLGVIPGRGHDFFRGWLARLAAFLLRKAAYSLILAVLLAVNAALAQATSQLGWLLSFGLQALFFWAVFLYRHQLTDRLLTATAGTGYRLEGAAGLAGLYLGTRAARRPLRGLRRRLRPSVPGTRTGASSARSASGAPPGHELGFGDARAEGVGAAGPPRGQAVTEGGEPPPTAKPVDDGGGGAGARESERESGGRATGGERPAGGGRGEGVPGHPPAGPGPRRGGEHAPGGAPPEGARPEPAGPGSREESPLGEALRADRGRLDRQPPEGRRPAKRAQRDRQGRADEPRRSGSKS
jgi:hypothetical protein